MNAITKNVRRDHLALNNDLDLNSAIHALETDKVQLAREVTAALDGFRGEGSIEDTVKIEETFHPDGSLASRGAVRQTKIVIVKE